MTKIVADTLSGIPVPEAQALGIAYLPQIVIFGDKSYRDDTEIDTATFLKMLAESPVLPKTAAPPPSLYNPIFQEALDTGETLIVICPSEKMSGTFRSATVAVQEFPDADIRVIDTGLIAGAMASIVLEANKMAHNNATPDEIVNRIEQMSQANHTYFLVDTLEYLHKGGRIGGAAALFGSILQMKPILTLRNRQIDAFENQRTNRKAITRLQELVVSHYADGDMPYITVLHGGALEKAKNLAEYFSSVTGQKDILIMDLPPAILVHTGPGVVSVSCFSGLR